MTVTPMKKPIGNTEVNIGRQVWMKRNLDVDQFRNGDLIPQAKSNHEWVSAGKDQMPVWCYYENSQKVGAIFGKLYNWYAIADPRGLAPKGWRIPGRGDWDTLCSLLKHESSGEFLKSRRYWGKGGGRDQYSFAAFPGGYRYTNGAFIYLKRYGYWWTSSELNSNHALAVYYSCFDDLLSESARNKFTGCSIRCLKE